jgi:hypothetical protein
MSEVNVNVTTPDGHLLIGEAAKQPNPKPYSFRGTIEAPAEYAKTYALRSDYNVAEASYGVYLEQVKPATIVLRLGHNLDTEHTVTGVLDIHPLLKLFSIGKKMPHKEFLKHLRQFRGHFVDIAEYSSVVGSMDDLHVGVSQNLTAKEDRRGNKSASSTKNVYLEIAETFRVGFPLFSDETENHVFSVDLCFEHSDMGVLFWMESYDLQKEFATYSVQKVDEQIKSLQDVGVTVLEA